MSLLDALLHFANLFALPLGTALITSLLAKMVGGKTLRNTPLARLVVWSGTAAVLAVIGGLVLAGRDGRMLTHGAMLLSIALALSLMPERR